MVLLIDGNTYGVLQINMCFFGILFYLALVQVQ